MRIVLFKLNHLGDNLVFLPVVQELRRRYPSVKLTVLTTPNEAALYGGPLAPHRLLTCEKDRFDKSYRRPWRLASWILQVRALAPDACYLAFDQATAAHLVAKLSGARVRIGGNLSHIRVKHSLTHEVPKPADLCPASWNWSMGAALVAAAGLGDGWPERPPAPDLSHLLTAKVEPKDGRPRILIHSGSSRPLNRWPTERFAQVAQNLAGDFEVIWLKHRSADATKPSLAREVELRSLPELASWIASADLYLGNNSGPMHVADALGCPGVAVTGPSAIGWNPFFHPQRWTVLRPVALACAPCESFNKTVLGCTNSAEPMACLNRFSAAFVEEACRQALKRAVPTP